MSTKKEDLLHMAEILFYDHGFHSIGLKKIVSDSGIALMTLYNHFGSKDELATEVLKRREERYMDHLTFFDTYLRDNGEHPDSAFVRIAVAHARWLTDHSSKGCLFLRAKEEYGSKPDHPIVELANGHKRRLKEFVQASDPLRSPEETLRLCLLLEGSTALAESESADTVARELVTMAELLFPPAGASRSKP
ncbi:TetR/AcrR family transcriptional regulator [Saccharibacillus alkalitolerans]|uniref:TetR/AcrR family transcriptional regulator n=1 Tax=Saccharibacillus alkalitolerans TaxID=2705290 RepID=A0ABX0F265_9BACL|nr:TetR/AcrR family transcriptional regulator [Saccharibacillus alkalitolerans]NGZ75066.1 TetR/AcrR family transcriptional regulator [Saccharibacillus alkalitolerans]